MSPRVSIKGAAAHLGTSVSSLNKRRVTGDGPPYYKIHGRITYSIADLDAYAERHRVKSTSQRKRVAERQVAGAERGA